MNYDGTVLPSSCGRKGLRSIVRDSVCLLEYCIAFLDWDVGKNEPSHGSCASTSWEIRTLQ